MMRDDEVFLSELELWPLVKLQRAMHGRPEVSQPEQQVRESKVHRSAMPPSSGATNRLGAASPVAQDYARKKAENTPPAPAAAPVPARVAKTSTAVPVAGAQIVLDPHRAEKIAALDWLALQNQISACADCGLCKQRKQAVFGLGAVGGTAAVPAPATWMFVGEAPSADDDSQGEPFLGESGRLVDSMLRAVGLSRSTDVFMTNVIKCRPSGNRTPTLTEITTCAPYLRRQIALVQPKIIVAFGKNVMQALTGSELPLSDLRGSVHRVAGVAAIVTFNPAFLLRNMADKAKAWDDLLLAKQTLASLA